MKKVNARNKIGESSPRPAPRKKVVKAGSSKKSTAANNKISKVPSIVDEKKLYFFESKSHSGLIGIGISADPETDLPRLLKRYELRAKWKISFETSTYRGSVAQLILKELSRKLEAKAISRDRHIYTITKPLLQRKITEVRNSIVDNLLSSESGKDRQSLVRQLEGLKSETQDYRKEAVALRANIRKLNQTKADLNVAKQELKRSLDKSKEKSKKLVESEERKFRKKKNLLEKKLKRLEQVIAGLQDGENLYRTHSLTIQSLGAEVGNLKLEKKQLKKDLTREYKQLSEVSGERVQAMRRKYGWPY